MYKTTFEFGKVLTVCHLSKISVNIYIAVCVPILTFKNILTHSFPSDHFL